MRDTRRTFEGFRVEAVLLVLASLVASSPAAGQDWKPARLERAPVARAASVEPAAPRTAAAATRRAVDSLLGVVERYDHQRAAVLERRYADSGESERRLLERRFGIVHHHFRVRAKPREIVGYWMRGPSTKADLLDVLEEIVDGRYAAYYFFDGVIRPNVFAPDRAQSRDETPVHEKVHLLQPEIYKALGIRCDWTLRASGCVRSLEPVAVYLAEFASASVQAPALTDGEINARIGRYLAFESARCRNAPTPRCPSGVGVAEYLVLPLSLVREVDRHGLEEGIRRFVEGLEPREMASRAR